MESFWNLLRGPTWITSDAPIIYSRILVYSPHAPARSLALSHAPAISRPLLHAPARSRTLPHAPARSLRVLYARSCPLPHALARSCRLPRSPARSRTLAHAPVRSCTLGRTPTGSRTVSHAPDTQRLPHAPTRFACSSPLLHAPAHPDTAAPSRTLLHASTFSHTLS